MAEAINVLMIQGETSDVELVSRILYEDPRSQFTVFHSRTFNEGLVDLENNKIDCIVFDFNPPNETSLNRLSSLCAHSKHIPVVVLTEGEGIGMGEKALRLGAQDYLQKNQLESEMLSRVIRYSIERKRSERVIRDNEERLREVLERSTDAIVVLDSQKRVRFTNPAAVYLFGKSPASLINAELDLPRIQSEPVEYILPRADEREVITEIISADLDWHGEQAILYTLRDITRRKRVEKELRERTAELQRKNEELDAFAHTVAHDLRSPLGVIVGFSEVLEDHHHAMSVDEVKEYLKLIVQAGFKMSSIVDELLVLAGVRQKGDVETTPLDMGPLIVEAKRRLTSLIDELNARIVVPDNWPMVLGHGPWVEEVWVNYISNAIKHGGRPPDVELGFSPQNNGMIRFWVCDNGEGLSAEQQSRLFTPFSRLNQARTKGHGLGLSIVARIMERLGGDVGVESEVGKGSTFYFTLPVSGTSPIPK